MAKMFKQEGIPFTQISNDLLNDSSLSLKSKGLYAFMYSKPNNWNFTIKSMSRQLKDGEKSIKSALVELKNSGWLTYTKYADGSGEYTLNWSPAPVVIPKVRKPHVGFRPLLVRKSINKKDTINTNPEKSKKKKENKSALLDINSKEASYREIDKARKSKDVEYDDVIDKIEYQLDVLPEDIDNKKLFKSILHYIPQTSRWVLSDKDIELIDKYVIRPIEDNILSYNNVADKISENIVNIAACKKKATFGNTLSGLKEMISNKELLMYG